MALVPMVVKQTNQGERSYDIYSRLLRRIIFISVDQQCHRGSGRGAASV